MAGPSGPAFLYNFYPRSPCGERQPRDQSASIQANYFYPRSPCGERRNSETQADPVKSISIHALLAESDVNTYHRIFGEGISIHALLAESDYTDLNFAYGALISIHALLAESDWVLMGDLSYEQNFYPRSPCGERHDTSSLMQCQAKFLSTLSLRRATFDAMQIVIVVIFLSTLSLRRATILIVLLILPIRFLSTLSLRRATDFRCSFKCTICNFYPRSPCGERRQQPDGTTSTTYFYPRSPCGERPGRI